MCYPGGLAMGDRERVGDTETGHPVWGHRPTEEAGLRGLADVAVVQAANFGKLHDLPRGGERDRPDVGGVLVEREMCARLMVIGEVAGQGAAEVSLVEHEDVIQALASDRADEPFREGILPRAL
jgi:hypothetical protein